MNTMGQFGGNRQSPSGSGRCRQRMRGRGPEFNCVCPSCGRTLPHERETPCVGMKCPQCGTAMVRE